MLSAVDVLHAKFSPTKFREGYDQDQVDDLLDRVVTTLRAIESGETLTDPLTADAVRDTRFQPTKFREGYDQDQVDDLLARVVATLQAPATATAHVVDATVDATPGTPGLIEPRRGWWERLLGR